MLQRGLFVCLSFAVGGGWLVGWLGWVLVLLGLVGFCFGRCGARIEARVLCILGRSSTTELQQPQIWLMVTQLVMVNLIFKPELHSLLQRPHFTPGPSYQQTDKRLLGGEEEGRAYETLDLTGKNVTNS